MSEIPAPISPASLRARRRHGARLLLLDSLRVTKAANVARQLAIDFLHSALRGDVEPSAC